MDINSPERFLKAQERTYDVALREITQGEKRSHWMWYIFPQLRGLGRSETAYYYGLSGLDEAKAYLAHPILSARLLEITSALLVQPNDDPVMIFGHTDALKLRSCMTLFASVSEEGSVFHQALQRFFKGKRDAKTLSLLDIQ